METFFDFSYGIIPVKQVQNKIEYFIVKHFSGKHWGFPKGHLEDNESPLDCAVRELFEETGFVVQDPLAKEFYEHYSFDWRGRLCQKKVTYFISRVQGTPSFDVEEISEGKWVSFETALTLFNFVSVKSLITQVRDFLLNSNRNYFR